MCENEFGIKLSDLKFYDSINIPHKLIDSDAIMDVIDDDDFFAFYSDLNPKHKPFVYVNTQKYKKHLKDITLFKSVIFHEIGHHIDKLAGADNKYYSILYTSTLRLNYGNKYGKMDVEKAADTISDYMMGKKLRSFIKLDYLEKLKKRFIFVEED